MLTVFLLVESDASAWKNSCFNSIFRWWCLFWLHSAFKFTHFFPFAVFFLFSFTFQIKFFVGITMKTLIKTLTKWTCHLYALWWHLCTLKCNSRRFRSNTSWITNRSTRTQTIAFINSFDRWFFQFTSRLLLIHSVTCGIVNNHTENKIKKCARNFVSFLMIGYCCYWRWFFCEFFLYCCFSKIYFSVFASAIAMTKWVLQNGNYFNEDNGDKITLRFI